MQRDKIITDTDLAHVGASRWPGPVYKTDGKY
jgi:hypothetical protein